MIKHVQYNDFLLMLFVACFSHHNSPKPYPCYQIDLFDQAQSISLPPFLPPSHVITVIKSRIVITTINLLYDHVAVPPPLPRPDHKSNTVIPFKT